MATKQATPRRKLKKPASDRRISFTALADQSRFYYELCVVRPGVVSVYNANSKVRIPALPGTFRIEEFVRLFAGVLSAKLKGTSGASRIPLPLRGWMTLKGEQLDAVEESCKRQGLSRDFGEHPSAFNKRRTVIRFGKEDPFVAVIDSKTGMIAVKTSEFSLHAFIKAAQFVLSDSFASAFAPGFWVPCMKPPVNEATELDKREATVPVDVRWLESYRSVPRRVSGPKQAAKRRNGPLELGQRRTVASKSRKKKVVKPAQRQTTVFDAKTILKRLDKIERLLRQSLVVRHHRVRNARGPIGVVRNGTEASVAV